MFALRVSLALVIAFFFAQAGTSYGVVRTYATVEETLEMAFPGAEFEKKTVKLTPEERKEIEALTKRRFFKRRVDFYIARKAGQTLGYATVMNEIGKTRYITFMVVLDPGGAVKSIHLLVFRESQGYEIDNPRWRRQFEGKTINDPLRLKRDIRNISGATLSVRAVTKGVKNVLAVFQVVRPSFE
jgi:Na+-translocating ferredoxin:NAD+ oxidoreductase RnfG subunit